MSKITDSEKIHKVVIVDDHEIFRQGLKTLIKGFDNLSVIGSLTDGKQLESFLEKKVPDIIIMDIHMPFVDGIAASKYVHENFPQVKIIALTMYSDSYTIDKAFKAGASAFLTKAITKKTFCEAIKHVLADIPYISADAAINYTISHLDIKDPSKEEKEISRMIKSAKEIERNSEFTDRDIAMVRYISKGCTSAEIGEMLNLSPRSIEKYRAELMKKLKVKNSTELVKLFIDKGLL